MSTINWHSNGLPDEAQMWRRQMEETVAKLAAGQGLNSAAMLAAARERAGLASALTGSNLTLAEQEEAIKEARRIPASPENPVVTSDAYFDEYGVPRAAVHATCDTVTLDTAGKAFEVAYYELHGRLNDSGEIWRKLADSYPTSDEAPNFAYAPLPAGEEWVFQMRAVSYSGQLGEFGGQVTLTLAKDTTPPPKPAPLVGDSRLGQTSLVWSGLTAGGQSQPPDFAYAEVWIANTVEAAGEAIGQMAVADTFYPEMQPYNQARWYWVVAVDLAGNRSVPSERIQVTTKPLVDTDVIGKVIDEANLTDGVNGKISDAYNDAQTARNEAQQAAQDASDALDEAMQAKIDAQAAATAAGTALTTANGKGRNLYGTSAQIAQYAPYSVHDTWFDTANDNRISRWSGSAWQLAQLGTGAIADASITNALIANLDAGKITTGELDAARIGANSITAEKLLIGDFTNLVNGSDFEDPEKIPWNLSNSAFSISTSANRVHSGTKCLYINAGSSTRVAYALSDFDVQEGDQFFMSVWASKSAAYDGTTGNSKIRVANADGGSIVAQLDYAAGRMAANAPPIQLTQTFTVPAGVTKLTFSIRADHTAGGLWLDDVVIRRMTAGELIVDGAVTASKIEAGAVTAGKIAANAVTADNIAAGTITADKLTIANLSNLIPDPSTETLDTWIAREGEASRWDTGISATYGTRGFRVNATGDYTSNSRLEPREPVKVNPGEIYACGAHVYRPSGGVGTVGVRIIYRDAGGALVSSGVTTPSVNSGWTDTASIHPVPEGAVTAHFEMYAASNAAGGLYWFMRPWMRPAATGELIVDGAISTDKLAANSVTSEKIVAGSVTAREIKALSVTAGELAANAVTADKIDAGAVTAVKVAANAITGEKISANAVTAGKIASNAITADKIQANAITSKHTITGALIRTAASGARTEMTSSGLRTLNSSGQELVRIGYGISTGMSVRNPHTGTLVPLADSAFGTVAVANTNAIVYNAPASETPASSGGPGAWSSWRRDSSDTCTLTFTAVSSKYIVDWSQHWGFNGVNSMSPSARVLVVLRVNGSDLVGTNGGPIAADTGHMNLFSSRDSADRNGEATGSAAISVTPGSTVTLQMRYRTNCYHSSSTVTGSLSNRFIRATPVFN